ncbi:hypothetical protein Nepgr_015569 [Nepenthes gracilis]|uniref:Uncharacterized protein n=1 Tax=Nepenthes gracilis TaxID=150966 RepID=A0AAD3SLC9_NEPGR|nr:hypothetical protein Nepgr_015569 [Nepenthes gracilis]
MGNLDCTDAILFNTSIHSALGKSPFEVLYGREPPSLLAYAHGTTKLEAVEKFLVECDLVVGEARENLAWAQNRMKQPQHKKHGGRAYEIGDCVYMSSCTRIANIRLLKGGTRNWRPRWDNMILSPLSRCNRRMGSHLSAIDHKQLWRLGYAREFVKSSYIGSIRLQLKPPGRFLKISPFIFLIFLFWTRGMF